MQAFSWFLGANDLGVSLVDPRSGECLDGLHTDRPNQNTGAESTLAYLLALLDVRQLARAGAIAVPSHISPSLALSA
jgi:hypothetical protein